MLPDACTIPGGDTLTAMKRRLLTVIACLTFCASTAGRALSQTVPADDGPFVTTLTLEQMTGKQGVLETDLGTVVIDLLPEVAPNHVGLFITQAEQGTYDGTIFHRMVARGIVQGGDPLTKDPDRVDVYGRGGLGLIAAEPNPERHTRGAVSAVVVPGQPDSGGTQFFICVVDQPSLDGQHTVWARVAEGINVVTMISETSADVEGRAAERVTLRSVTVRDTPPPEPIPFATETDEELAGYGAVLETDRGRIVVEFYPDRAPNHVRHFLRLAQEGVFDGMAFHRVVPGFVIQTGHLPTRTEPLTERQERMVENLQPEFSDTPHVRVILSMDRDDDPASASTSFFICTDVAEELDGQYTVFGVVVEGLDVVAAIERVPADGDERPLDRVELREVRVVRRD